MKIEGVSWQGFLCPLDDKPRRFQTCFDCQHDVCDVPVLRAMGKPFPVIENEYHVTEVVGPPRIMKFRRENPYYMNPDDALFMMIGTAVHEKIDRAFKDYEMRSLTIPHTDHEVGFRYDLSPHTIVGTMDMIDYDRKLIQDYKCLGAWKTRDLLNKALKGTLNEDEYGLQLNGYRQWGFHKAENLRLHCIIRDYNNRNKSMYKLESQQIRINVPITNRDMDDLARENIEESLKDEPRMCTQEETWGKLRCQKFCPNYLCENYGGSIYHLGDVG